MVLSYLNRFTQVYLYILKKKKELGFGDLFMAIVKTEHPHIIKVEEVCGGVPIIEGTRISVWAIVGWLRQGYSLQSIKEEIYPHLSLAQLHDAASYYYDHQGAIEAQLQDNNLSDQELEERREQWKRLTRKADDPSSSS